MHFGFMNVILLRSDYYVLATCGYCQSGNSKNTSLFIVCWDHSNAKNQTLFIKMPVSDEHKILEVTN
jgi:hypothetical protein